MKPSPPPAFTALASLMIAAVITTGCQRSHTAEVAPPGAKVADGKIIIPPESPQLAVLGVETALPGQPTLLRLNGRLAWDDRVTVRVFTPFGGRVTRILAEPGQTVHAGDPLALIASPDYGQAQADARKANSDFSLAERTLSRVRELLEHGAAPQKDLDAAQSDFSRAQAELQRAGSRLASYGGNTNSVDQLYELRSPLGGVVVEKNLNPGQEVRPDQMLAGTDRQAAPLFTVTDPAQLWIQLDATENDLPHLHTGQEFTFTSRSLPGQSFTGRIEVISEFIDPISRSLRIRGSIPNPQRQLKAEMFVTVEVGLGDEQAGAEVPSKAVFLRGDKYFVFVEEARGRFARREVKAGSERLGRLHILEGVHPGQRVVADGSLLLEQLFQTPEGG